MREPSLDAVLKRAKELWKEVGYTDGAEARSVSCLGGRLPRARVLLTPTRLQEFIQQARNELRKKGIGCASRPARREAHRRCGRNVRQGHCALRPMRKRPVGSPQERCRRVGRAGREGACQKFNPKRRSDIARAAAVGKI